MTSKVIYSGNLRTQCVHLKSGNTIYTDAPTDNQGKGEAFSPTDLLATSLAACMFTIMGIKARDLNLSLEGMEASVLKVMSDAPRKVAAIEIVVAFPDGVRPDEKNRTILERAARTCPVYLSLAEEVQKNITFRWNF